MLCSSCDKKRPIKIVRLDLSKYRIEGRADHAAAGDHVIERLDCEICDNFIAIKVNNSIVDNNNGINDINYTIININESDDDGNEKKMQIETNHWHEAKTVKERMIYYILSQIIYPERDTPNKEKFESEYDFADQTDLIMLRRECGVPIGFYTLKLRGSKILTSTSNELEYAMTTLDTAYIRSEYRNRGIGTEILKNIIETFPNEDIGFSRPISLGMWKVLEKFLTINKNYRLKFWEIEDGGSEGSRKLIWFTLKKNQKSNGSYMYT